MVEAQREQRHPSGVHITSTPAIEEEIGCSASVAKANGTATSRTASSAPLHRATTTRVTTFWGGQHIRPKQFHRRLADDLSIALSACSSQCPTIQPLCSKPPLHLVPKRQSTEQVIA